MRSEHMRAGVFGFAGLLRLRLFSRRRRLPMKLKTFRLELCVCLGIEASGDDVMRNALAGFLASGFAIRRGLQTDLSHLRCPLPVMV
jgi:hypothetical protein